MTARGNLIGLLGALVIVATFAFSTTDRASAQSVYNWSISCHPESYVWYVTDGNFRGSKSNIPCDEPQPGWTFDIRLSNVGDILFIYDGDSVHTPITNSAGMVTSTPLRKVRDQGNTRPPEEQPLDTGDTTAFTWNADTNNRAVRGANGECYREQKLSNGKWKRSGSYGSGLEASEACRRARWNAYYRSQGDPLRHPNTGTFDSGNPPGYVP